MSTRPVVAGAIVLTWNLGIGWQPDWDGRLHPKIADAEAQYDAAAKFLGAENVRLVTVQSIIGTDS